MAAERWTHIAAIVEEAIALPADARPDYVRTACRDDTDLDRQVRSLLSHHLEEEALRAADTSAPRLVSFSAESTPPRVHERFERLEWLGTGGFGDVYRAYDRVHRQPIALKVLRHVDPVRLDRFKQEFRKTTTIDHPNVVQLHELFADGDHWFFTMELVDGVPILDYIRGSAPPTRGALTGGAWQRLSRTFEQLIAGVSALHAAGIVHGDLKPQNVLVSAHGRVVLLDFGLVRDIAQQPSLVAGTPAYMAPEQLVQAPVAEAADWYSVGVLLYEALTATVPFSGTFWDVLWRKQHEDVSLPTPGELPDALVALCQDLLQRQPEKRPAAREILERLAGPGAGAAGHSRSAVSAGPDTQRLFVGRRRQLDMLHEAWDRVASGHPTAVHLQGVSGIGKSTLVRHFLDTIRRDHDDAVVLSGRCFASESVPFKALDELVDGLARYLSRLDDADVAALLPRDQSLLTRVFPALKKVAGLAAPPRHAADTPGAQELRDRALSALRELLERLAARKPVVLWIDDLQWGDFDSLRVLRDLQQPSDAPRLLLILSYRSEDAGTSLVLRAVADHARDGKTTGTVRELTLDQLPRDEARELAAALCGALPEADRAGLVDEAAGSPLFLHELARHVIAGQDSTRHAPSLSAMIEQRVERLQPSLRRLLDVIAVAGQPLARQVAIHAAELDDPRAESQLIADFLIRASQSTASGELDTFHDKVREAVLGLMSNEQRRGWHARLARTLEAEGTTDPKRLVHHFAAAGIEASAYRCALQAGVAAENCLAFEQAASLFRLALDLHSRLASDPSALEREALDAGELWRKLARSLAGAGRSADAAHAYLQASERASSRDGGGDLRRLAVDQLMRSGQINEGLSLLTTTLRTRGVRIPRRRSVLLAAVVARRLRIRMRGLGFRERTGSAIAPAALTEIDRLWTAGATLAAIDPLLSSYLRGRHLLLALRAGDPFRISLGLALEAIQRAMRGANAYPAARRILDRARELAVRSDQPYAEGIVLTGEASVAHLSGRARDALRYSLQAEETLTVHCTGVAWELATIRAVVLSALGLSGQWSEHTRRLGKLLHDAEGNGDLYTQCALPLSAGGFLGHLAADDPAAARQALDRQIAQWARSEFDIPRSSHWHGTVETLLYEGRCEEAWQLVTGTWPVLKRTLMLRMDLVRLLAGQLRARCAVALDAVAPRPEILVVAERFAADCARSRSTLAQGFGLVIDAALTVSRANQERAIAKLQLAEERFREVGAAHYVAASCRRRGELLGGEDGTALIRQADLELTELGAMNPSRMVDRLVPGAFSPAALATRVKL